MRLIFIRHGETETNTAGLTHKSVDSVGLNAHGREQAKKLVPALKANGIEKIYYSPEIRAKETAEIVSGELKIATEAIFNLRERDWGEWQGKSWAELKTVLDTMILEERYNFVPPGGESWKQLEERLKQSLTKITNGKELCVGIVTHGGSLRGLMPILKEQPLQTSLNYDFKNTSVTIFDYSGGKYIEVLENDISHLDGP